jgi:hypothetical protein
MMGMIGNQDKKILNAPSISPEIIPAELVLKPPEALTLENPLMTLLAKINKKTIKSQSFVTGTSKRNLVFFTVISNRKVLQCQNCFTHLLEFIDVIG